MRKARLEDMELGNLMFGNSRGKYKVPRDEFQNAFCEFLETIGFDHYGHSPCNEDHYENDTFLIRPYYWGEDEEIAALSNFVYKPTGLEISWYKYPMRDAYSNQNIDICEFKYILDHCLESIGAILWA